MKLTENLYEPKFVYNMIGKFISQIAAGDFHSLVLTNKGDVYSTGNNKYG